MQTTSTLNVARDLSLWSVHLYNQSVVLITTMAACLINRHLKERQKKRRRAISNSSKKNLSCKSFCICATYNVSAQSVDICVAYITLFFTFQKNAEYKKSVRKDIKGRKMILVEEGEEEEDLEIWTYRLDDQVRFHLENKSLIS